MTQRGYNPRFLARPETVFVPADADETVIAVQRAVDQGPRIATRSGGHCFEEPGQHPETKAIIDLSLHTDVRDDATKRAFSVEAVKRLPRRVETSERDLVHSGDSDSGLGGVFGKLADPIVAKAYLRTARASLDNLADLMATDS